MPHGNAVDLQEIMNFIGERYVFTPEHYPVLEGMSYEQRKAFAVSHSAHHMMKSLGKIAAQAEAYDHGGTLDKVALREAIVKMFINTLKLAEEMGFSARHLATAVPVFIKRSQIQEVGKKLVDLYDKMDDTAHNAIAQLLPERRGPYKPRVKKRRSKSHSPR